MRKLINLLGSEISYFDLRPEKTDAIILVHGNSQSFQFFDPLLKHPLLTSFRVVALDLPGHGASAKRGTYKLGDFLDVIEALIEQLALNR